MATSPKEARPAQPDASQRTARVQIARAALRLETAHLRQRRPCAKPRLHPSMCAGFGGLGLAARIRAPRLPRRSRRRSRRRSSSARRARKRRTQDERSGAHRPAMRLGPKLPTCIAAGGAGSSGDSSGLEGKRGVLRARCYVGWFSRAKGIRKQVGYFQNMLFG